MRALIVTAFVAVLAVAACSPQRDTPSTSPVPTPVPTLYLRPMGEPEFCLLAGLPPPPITFRIDPAALWPEQVTAVDGTGEVHHTFWGIAFTGGTPDDPVVRVHGGVIAVRDGDQVRFPARGQPTINGFDVCSGNNALYILSPRS